MGSIDGTAFDDDRKMCVFEDQVECLPPNAATMQTENPTEATTTAVTGYPEATKPENPWTDREPSTTERESTTYKGENADKTTTEEQSLDKTTQSTLDVDDRTTTIKEAENTGKPSNLETTAGYNPDETTEMITESSTTEQQTDTTTNVVTTDQPSSTWNGKCEGDGYYSDKDDCKKFYRCNMGRESEFTCGDGTAWDQNTLACTHEDMNEACEGKQGNFIVLFRSYS